MTDPNLPWDVDLVWASPPKASPKPCQPAIASSLRLWLAAIADVGVASLCCLVALALTASYDLHLSPLQVALSVVFALLILGSSLQVGWLWVFHASFGMRLMSLRFCQPLTPAQAVRVWGILLLTVPLLGLPLVFGKSGHRLWETVAGCQVRVEKAPATV